MQETGLVASVLDIYAKAGKDGAEATSSGNLTEYAEPHIQWPQFPKHWYH